MNLKICYIGLFLLSFTYPAWSQDCITPSSPVLTLVSVTPGPPAGKSDLVNLSWEPNPAESIDAFILYLYSERDNGYMSFDTIWNPQSRNYSYNTFAARQVSLRYVVASYRKPLAPGEAGCPSPLSNSLETILCKTRIDTCESTITVSWNKYPENNVKIRDYRIYVSENGGMFAEKYITSSDSSQYIIKEFSPDTQYCFSVRAVLENGLFSGSNNSCLTATMQTPPGWIETDYISVNEANDIELAFIVDQQSEIRKFILERAAEGQPYNTLAVLDGIRDRITYTDSDADITKVYSYRVSALNGCNQPVTVSESFSNIRLGLSSEGNDLTLAWNRISREDRLLYEYELWLNTGNGYAFEGNAGSDSVFVMELSDIIYRITGVEVCFYLKAKKITSLHGGTGESISSRVCISPEEGITVPNLFTPNNDLKNDLFRPVLAFTPRDYHLVVSDRPGKILFESRDHMEEWDGSDAAEGVYLWWLRVTTPSGKSLSKTGTITIIR